MGTDLWWTRGDARTNPVIANLVSPLVFSVMVMSGAYLGGQGFRV